MWWGDIPTMKKHPFTNMASCNQLYEGDVILSWSCDYWSEIIVCRMQRMGTWWNCVAGVEVVTLCIVRFLLFWSLPVWLELATEGEWEMGASSCWDLNQLVMPHNLVPTKLLLVQKALDGCRERLTRFLSIGDLLHQIPFVIRWKLQTTPRTYLHDKWEIRWNEHLDSLQATSCWVKWNSFLIFTVNEILTYH